MACTLFPDGCWGLPCCKRHDRRYANHRITKRQADILLKRCIEKRAKQCTRFYRLVALVMYLGVRTPVSIYFYRRANKKAYEVQYGEKA